MCEVEGVRLQLETLYTTEPLWNGQSTAADML